MELNDPNSLAYLIAKAYYAKSDPKEAHHYNNHYNSKHHSDRAHTERLRVENLRTERQRRITLKQDFEARNK